jgi:hypothetical protein
MIYLKLSWCGPVWGPDCGVNNQRSGFQITWEDWHDMQANIDGASYGLFMLLLLHVLQGLNKTRNNSHVIG